MTTLAQAIKNWEAASPLVDGVAVPNGSAEEATYIKLYCQMPPITKLDGSINTLHNCERLALSTNSIDKIVPLTNLPRLKILSLGRNLIKKISDLEGVAGTLEELWISYNQISSLDGLNALSSLTTLYMSNNQLKSWAELDKIAGLPNLRDVLFFGNPMYDDFAGNKDQCRIEILKRLPNLAKIDGDLVKPGERELATGIPAAS